MARYEAFEFKVLLGSPGGAQLCVRVHAPDRESAWARVRQMHPRAIDAARLKRSGCEQIHENDADRLNFAK